VIHCPLSVRLRSLSQFLIILAVAAECLVFGFLSSSFLTLNNFVNVALQIAIYGVLAVGMTLVIITGGIDLSVGSVVALAGVMAAGVLEKMTGHPLLGIGLAVAVGIGIGTLSGAFSGLMITRLRVPPFIVTLALMTVCRGLAFIFTGGFSIGNLPLGFGFLGRDHLGPIPVPVVTMAIVFLGGYLLLSKSYKGRYIYAIGGNEEASRLSGIDTRRVVLQVYLLNGSLAGLAGITLASRLGAGVPNSGLQYELDVIAAVVVGGTSLMGGVGSIAGTFWGTVFIGILNNG
jgi:ribose/xylose/arabinose/galactoside ABC-type transport system permease subunit